MAISKDYFMQHMVKLMDLMNFKINKGTLEAVFEKVYWCDPRALDYAKNQMEEEDRWSSKVFLRNLRFKDAICREEAVEKKKSEDFRNHLKLLRQSEECPGGDRCRNCDTAIRLTPMGSRAYSMCWPASVNQRKSMPNVTRSIQ